jgi:hypothetical protein
LCCLCCVWTSVALNPIDEISILYLPVLYKKTYTFIFGIEK